MPRQSNRACLVRFWVAPGLALGRQALTGQQRASQAPEKRGPVSFPGSQAERRFLHGKARVRWRCKQPISRQLYAPSLARGVAANQSLIGCMRRAWSGRIQASKHARSFPARSCCMRPGSADAMMQAGICGNQTTPYLHWQSVRYSKRRLFSSTSKCHPKQSGTALRLGEGSGRW